MFNYIQCLFLFFDGFFRSVFCTHLKQKRRENSSRDVVYARSRGVKYFRVLSVLPMCSVYYCTATVSIVWRMDHSAAHGTTVRHKWWMNATQLQQQQSQWHCIRSRIGHHLKYARVVIIIIGSISGAAHDAVVCALLSQFEYMWQDAMPVEHDCHHSYPDPQAQLVKWPLLANDIIRSFWSTWSEAIFLRFVRKIHK